LETTAAIGILGGNGIDRIYGNSGSDMIIGDSGRIDYNTGDGDLSTVDLIRPSTRLSAPAIILMQRR
jgi:hypothetical protein